MPAATYSLGPVYDVLHARFTTHRKDGQLDVRQLAGDLGISHQAIYKWFDKAELPAIAAIRLIRLSREIHTRNRLSINDVIHFIKA
jgi:cupin superfamily acireductone dioxygenase involved in methionine salvage